MYGDIIRNAFSEIAHILNRDTKKLQTTKTNTKEPRVKQ